MLVCGVQQRQSWCVPRIVMSVGEWLTNARDPHTPCACVSFPCARPGNTEGARALSGATDVTEEGQEAEEEGEESKDWARRGGEGGGGGKGEQQQRG